MCTTAYNVHEYYFLKRRKVRMAGIHVPDHAQVADKRGITRAGLVVAKQLRLAAAGGKRVELRKRGVPDSGAGHGIHGDIQRIRG